MHNSDTLSTALCGLRVRLIPCLMCSPLSAQELELEDTQSRLQQDLRQRMLTEGRTVTHPQINVMRVGRRVDTAGCISLLFREHTERVELIH